jgi:primosomal protein N' (replication factor Y) (superfamily II helicase)
MTVADGETLLADVALPVPVARAFTYSVPEALSARAIRGARVLCPFGSRRLVGVVVARRQGPLPARTKALADALDPSAPTVPEELLDFLAELARYYMAPIGEVMRLAVPSASRIADDSDSPSLFPSGHRASEGRRVQWAAAIPNARATTPLRGQSDAIWQHLVTHGETEVMRLAATWKSARPAVARLQTAGLVRIEERLVPADPFFSEAVAHEAAPDLTVAQTSAVAHIADAIGKREPRTAVLHGVTGSGKTEVYLASIALVRAQARGALVLVPEIALTPQLVARYRGRFGDEVAVLHSALTARERRTMWERLHDGTYDVAIGARSALFAPIRKLGLIIVDEEHDSSFKQEEGVRYHARDMAILRAHRASGLVILGSATPSLETEYLTRTGRADKIRLPGRARAQSMPTVEAVDLRRMGAGPAGDRRLSLPLHRALEATLGRGEQAIIFLNRRGFAPSVRCEACGELAACPSCSVALTFHRRSGGTLACHYCGHTRPSLPRCDACGSPHLVMEGLGTEKLEETLGAAFPTARIARLDRDVASGRGIEKVLARVRAREVDILVGTQMVAKGHDLPHVTLVGVINADAALSIPDFRAAERGFALLVQVAGRAGRGDGERRGLVLLQTYDPDQPAIVFAAGHDVDGFLERELKNREELGYPPFSRIVLVRLEATVEADARDAAMRLAEVARGVSAPGVEVLGPAPAPLARLRNRYRYRVMLRGKGRAALRAVVSALDQAREALPKRVRVIFDVDPVQLL